MTVDLDTATLGEAVAGLADGSLGSVELLEAQLDRVDTWNPSVNAVVAFDVDRAMAEARGFDQARAEGAEPGPLGGVSLTLKDCYETAGLVTTAGSPTLAEHVPDVDADVTAGLRHDGAIVYGKSNVPLFAGDHQTYNEVYGLTRNAWDPDRTAGGSSGGAAVSVSCGFSLGEVGSDIGSSIRFPSHCNGLFGLKPTWGVISERGHVPPAPGATTSTDLGVMGPLGRSVDDLSLLLDACLRFGSFGGVPGATLPSAGEVDLGSLRVGLWADDVVAPVDRITTDAIGAFAAALGEAGAVVDPDARPSVAAADLHDTYGRLLTGVMTADLPPKVLEHLAGVAATIDGPLDAGDPDSFALRNARDSTALHRDWLRADDRRHRARAAWAELFERVDVVAMPIAQTQAFPHDTERTYRERTVRVDDTDRAYHEILFWAGLATMPGLPSVALPLPPVLGLPIGVQLVGPRWSDRRLLAIAGAISEALDLRFRPPTLVTG